MKKLKLIPAFIVYLFLNGTIAFSQNNSAKKATKGFALLELYTSEGCSSCPPADELMGKLQNEYKENKVYILAYHVDYWDRQGWKDVFSNADYTKRQYEYAKYLGKEPIYTPQLIVNGKADYIGSEEAMVRNAIKGTLAKPKIVDLFLEANLVDNKLNVSYGVNKDSKNNRLVLAIVQKSAKSNVKRGENANRILSHFQIVRHLESVALSGNLEGITSISLLKGFNTKEYEVIGFVQDVNSGVILAAERATIISN
tara:strand:- start:19270 stop:20034 length:765 start_codon:yes stop_codon:yes gene_type:complete